MWDRRVKSAASRRTAPRFAEARRVSTNRAALRGNGERFVEPRRVSWKRRALRRTAPRFVETGNVPRKRRPSPGSAARLVAMPRGREGARRGSRRTWRGAIKRGACRRSAARSGGSRRASAKCAASRRDAARSRGKAPRSRERRRGREGTRRGRGGTRRAAVVVLACHRLAPRDGTPLPGSRPGGSHRWPPIHGRLEGVELQKSERLFCQSLPSRWHDTCAWLGSQALSSTRREHGGVVPFHSP